MEVNFRGKKETKGKKRGKKETKSNANENMRTYLLRMKKGVSSVNEKMTKKLQ